MKAYKANVPIYAETDADVKEFEDAFFDFVDYKRSKGIAITAKKMARLLAQIKDNPIINTYLK
jgi:hypothetical protein